MFIITQDRDLCVEFKQEKLYIRTIVNKNILFGFSIMYGDGSIAEGQEEDDDIVIGTFETYELCEEELEKMYACDKEYFVVDGFEDY